MKKCPDCHTNNRSSNLFCPTCGCSFLDAHPRASPDTERELRSDRRALMVVAVVTIVLLGATAGLISFFVSRQIAESSVVTVETGTVWKCEKCGELYRQRVATIEVKEAEADQYFVDVIDGECFYCRYGEVVGGLQGLIDWLSREGYFYGFQAEIDGPAAVFMSEHPELFPAPDEAACEPFTASGDPRALFRDFSQITGKPVHLTAEVVSGEVATSGEGAVMTFLQLTPLVDGEPLPEGILALYPGEAPVYEGDVAESYVLPVTQVRFEREKKQVREPLCVVMSMRVVEER